MTSDTRAKMAEDHRKQTEENARKLGSLESDVTGLKGDVASLKGDMRQGFDAIFAKMDRNANRPTQWGAIAVLITVLMALAAWANSWVSASISGVGGNAAEALRRADDARAELRSHATLQAEREVQAAERRGRVDELLRRMDRGFDNTPGPAKVGP
jgi:TolA-binding protein